MATIDRRGATLSATDPPTATDPNPDLAIKTAVRVATTGANVTLAGLQTIDGVALAAGDRVLVKDQADATTNGIYAASTGNWARTVDAANNSQWADGLRVSATDGTQAGTTYALAAANPVQLGTSALFFVPLTTGLSFVRNGRTASYGLLPSDNGKLIALGGNAFFTLSAAAASGYAPNFSCMIINEDGYTGPGSGRGKTIALNGLASFILWPGQSIIVFNDNNGWAVSGRSRWRMTVSPTFFVDPGGSNANDGLAAGTANAVQTLQQAAVGIAQQQVDYLVGAVVTIQLADGTHTGGLHWPGLPVGGTGNASMVIAGNAASPGNVIVAGPGNDTVIATFDKATLEVKNFKIEDTTGACALAAETGAVIRIEGAMIFGKLRAGGFHLRATGGGSQIIADVGYSISDFPLTGNGFHALISDGGNILLAGVTVNVLANLTFATTVFMQRGGRFFGPAWNLNAFTVTAQPYYADGLSQIQNAGTIPGTGAAAGQLLGGSGGNGADPITVGAGGTGTTTSTGSGSVVLSTSPTLVTPIAATIYGGSAAGSALNLQSTSSGSPSGDAVTVTTGGAVRAKWLSNGNHGLGTETNPQAPVVLSNNVTTGLAVVSGTLAAFIGADNANSFLEFDKYGTGASGTILFQRALGTAASPSNVTSGTILGQFQARSYTNGAFVANSTARVLFKYLDTSPNTGTAISFEGTPAGTTSSAQALQAMGGVTIGTGINDPGNGVLQLKAQAFASLAAASAAMEGALAAVTDSTTATWGATITGGGANHVLAYCDGTNWTVAGK